MTYSTLRSRFSTSRGHSSQDTPQIRKNRPLPSERPPKGISFNLVSLVTKFEAMDALSMPFTKTSLHPTPLQVSRKLSTRKGATGSNYRSRLSTIFSPRRGSPAKHDHECSEEEIQELQADIFGSSKSRDTSILRNRHDPRKLSKPQTLHNHSSVKTRGGASDASVTVRVRAVGSIAAPYVQNEVPDEKRRGSIKEKISFYDGAVATGDSTQATPSTTNTVRPNTPTSVPHSRLLDKSYFLTPSTASSKRTCAQLTDADTATPTRPRGTSAAIQSLKFGQDRPLAQTSPGGSFYSEVTSQTVRSTRHYRTGQNASPTRISAQRRRMTGPIGEGRNATATTKTHADSGTGGDGSVPPPSARDDEIDTISSRRRVSSKIEELYRERVRGMEIKRDNAQNTKQAETRAKLSAEARKSQEQETKTTEPRPGRLAEITRTKVAAMRKLFDGKFSPKSLSPEPCCGLDPILDTIESPPSPPSPPPSLPQQQIYELRAVTPPAPDLCELSPTPSPKTLPQVTEIRPSKAEQAPGVFERAQTWQSSMTGTLPSTPPIKRVSPAKSKLIEEKLKKFENPAQEAQPSRGKMFRRRLSKSLRSIFEISSRKSQEEEPGKSKPPVALANRERVWSPVPDDKNSKRAPIVERWTKTPTAVSSQGDGTASEPEDPKFGKMIRKSAECSLRQPRPVRAVEMQRMARICKDRVGGVLERETRGRVLGRG